MERAEISRRLKAARWLAGEVDERGRVTSLSPEALASREPLARNGITANAITEIERLIKDARPMELREISLALDLPPTWFTDDPPWVEVNRRLPVEAAMEAKLADRDLVVREIAVAEVIVRDSPLQEARDEAEAHAQRARDRLAAIDAAVYELITELARPRRTALPLVRAPKAGGRVSPADAGERAKRSASTKAREAAERLEGSQPEAPESPRAAGGEGREG